MTRIVVFIALIVVFRKYHLASIWLLFTMLILQSCYLFQEWKFPKFDCKILKSLNWTNELFLTSFMLFFIGFRRYTDYQNSTIRSVAILMILLNTGAVLLLQLSSVLYTLIQLCSTRKDPSCSTDQENQQFRQTSRQGFYANQEQVNRADSQVIIDIEEENKFSSRNNEEEEKDVDSQTKNKERKKDKERRRKRKKIYNRNKRERLNKIQSKRNTQDNFHINNKEIDEENSTLYLKDLGQSHLQDKSPHNSSPSINPSIPQSKSSPNLPSSPPPSPLNPTPPTPKPLCHPQHVPVLPPHFSFSPRSLPSLMRHQPLTRTRTTGGLSERRRVRGEEQDRILRGDGREEVKCEGG